MIPPCMNGEQKEICRCERMHQLHNFASLQMWREKPHLLECKEQQKDTALATQVQEHPPLLGSFSMKFQLIYHLSLCSIF